MNNLVLYAFILTLLLFSRGLVAKNWQIMLIPHNKIELNNGFELNRLQQNQFEQGLETTLSQSLEKLVQSSLIFEQCEVSLCGKPSIKVLLDEILTKAPEIELLGLYSTVRHSQQIHIQIDLIDPLSHQIIVANSIQASIDDINNNMVALGQNMGSLLAQKLSTTLREQVVKISLVDFKREELQGLTTFVLGADMDSQMVLKRSNQRFRFGQNYFPVISSQYELITNLSASQIKNVFSDFFEGGNTPIVFSFDSESDSISIIRSGNPYTPSLLTLGFLLFAFVVLSSYFVRRQYLNYYLKEFAELRNADEWLSTYKVAKKPIYGLAKKWASQASYWNSRQVDSSKTAQKAKLYFDAGDIITAKLFVTKALHTNTVNKDAKALTQKIAEYENNTKVLSDNEQWIRNKIAKAMNNYRQQDPLKALKQAYQAHAKSLQLGNFKKQTKAIAKLIKKIKSDYSYEIKSIVIFASNDPISITLTQHSVVHLGRLPNKSDFTWISGQDSVFYINHKLVSRAGHHCSIESTASGFALRDQGSKNGSFINELACESNTLCALTSGDTLYLGANNSLNAVNLKVNMSRCNELVDFSFIPPSETLLSREKLNKIWPDNALAIRTKLLCIKTAVILALTNDDEKIVFFTKADEIDISRFTPLCIIKLGEQATIMPTDNAPKLSIEGIDLIGEVPLQLPCSLTCHDVVKTQVITIQINQYDGVSMRYAEHSISELPAV